MTPFKRDCQNITPVHKEVDLADGTKILCKHIGHIIIPLESSIGTKYNLRLKKVLIIPKLDRRLFSVSAFLQQGNNWVNFTSDRIELGVKEGPRIQIPLTSLQTTAMTSRHSTKSRTPWCICRH